MSEGELVESGRQRVVRIVIEAGVIGATAATGGLVIGGPGGGIAAAGVSVVATTWHAIWRARGDRAERAVEGGLDLAEMSPDQFADWVEADPRNAGLVVAVVESAARSTTEAHLDALARVLADGAGDDARIDVDTLIGHAIGDLGPAHLQVLVFLRREDRDAGERVSQHSTDALSIEMPRLREGMASLVATLTATGCVAIEAGGFGGGPTGYRITTFGRACLSFFHDRAADRDDPSQHR